MLGNLNKQTRRTMKELGLQMPADKLYSSKRPSLKDAVVSFGGFCSGVVVSEDGLVFTNHHCGFSCVQQHSSVEHDYLKDGFVAHNRSEELPNPELYVRFLLRTEDVTKRVLGAVKPEMTESERAGAVDSVMFAISEEVAHKDSTLVGIVDAYYGGNEFWLSTYRDYNDVRLVFAPPSSVGKFGWDTDNWVWPRHTGDFCVFRIYADKNNRPADYSPENVPYHPEYVAPISLDGYKEGSFCMTLGYPGRTERYLSSFGIEEMMNNDNQAQIDVRGIKLATYASRCIENEILMYFRSQRKLQGEVSLSDAIDTDKEGGSLYLLDVVGTDDTMLSDLQDREEQLLLRRLVRDCLTEREADIIRRRYGLEGHPPQTQRQVAAIYGISRSYVSRIEKRALEKLEKELRKG